MIEATAAPLVWADANVFLRLLTGKSATQAASARTLMERADRGEVRLWVCGIVTAEVIWVLTRSYGLSRSMAAQALLELFTADGIVLDESPFQLATLQTMAATSVDFADAYLATRARTTGTPVASFDRDFDKLGVERLDLTPE